MLLLLLACATRVADAPKPVDPSVHGPWSVGHHRTALVLDDGGADRALTVEVWYPTDEGGAAVSVSDAFYDEPSRTTYADLLDAADPACPTSIAEAAAEAPPAAGTWPVVVSSHCTDCTRFGSLTVAERLASHGVVVVAPDHAGDTLLDDLAGTSLPLDTTTLARRRDDLAGVLDAALAGDLMEGLTLDSSRVGALGHSFGSVSVGLWAQTDARVRAVMGMAAPMSNPLLPGVEMAELDLPLMLVVAQEDHSIFEIGNELIRSNWEEAPGPAWKAELVDAGHWSVSDLCGLVEGFMPCCGEDERQQGDERFDYVDPALGRRRAATVAAGFFLQELELAGGVLDGLVVEGTQIDAR